MSTSIARNTFISNSPQNERNKTKIYFCSTEKDLKRKRENDKTNIFFEDFKNSLSDLYIRNHNSKMKNTSNLLLKYSNISSEFDYVNGRSENKKAKMKNLEESKNKKIEILLNARNKEQRLIEKKTKFCFSDDFLNTNNLKHQSKTKNDFNEYFTREKLDKYKYDFIKIHKKQIETERDKKNLIQKLLEKSNQNSHLFRKSLDVGKFHYFLKTQFEDKSFFDDCCEDTFFDKDKNSLVKINNKSLEKNNLTIFNEKVKVINNNNSPEKESTFIMNSSQLSEIDATFKKLYETLILGNKRFLEKKSISPSNSDKKNSKINENLRNFINLNELIANTNKCEVSNKPKYFFFACTDCKFDIPNLLGLNHSDVFIYKNIGNIIVSNDINFLCALRYAIENLKITQFFILGHTGCNALKEAIYPSKQGEINKWLKNIRSIAENNRNQLYEEKRDSEKYESNFSEVNVREQMKRLTHLEIMRKYIEKGEKIYIHGYVINGNTGELKALEIIYS